MPRLALLVAAIAAPLAAAPRIPADAPYCAPPGTHPLFVSPMGEPFRAAPGQPYPSAAWSAGADRDRDGAVDRTEFVADADRFFRTLDRDRDGRLDPQEIGFYEDKVAPEIALYSRGGRDAMLPPDRNRPRDGESGYGGPMGAGRFGWLNVPEPVAAADADVDRIVSAREFAAAAARRFDLLAPGGRLTLAALPKTFAQAALEGPCRPRPKPRKDGRDDDRRDEAPDARDRRMPR